MTLGTAIVERVAPQTVKIGRFPKFGRFSDLELGPRRPHQGHVHVQHDPVEIAYSFEVF